MRLRSRRRLQVERQAGGDEADPVGHGGEPLVQPAGMVDEGAAELAHRHDAQADLVGDQHHRARQRRSSAASSAVAGGGRRRARPAAGW